ncbi:MAG: DUF3303 family protein [Acidimicrobiia bacterium]
MKFVLAYTWRDGGSVAEREAAEKRSMQLLSKFEPSMEIATWVDRIDGQGGFAVFESDDPAAMTKDIAIWGPLLQFELHPVIDIGDATPVQQEAIDFRDSIS